MAQVSQKNETIMTATSITKEVWDIIKSDLALQKDITRRVINTRALARYILNRYPIKASMDSLISAIRRFDRGKSFEETEKKLTNLFKDCPILTKNNMVCITLKKEAERSIPVVCNIKDINTNNAFRIITGSKNVKIIADQNEAKEILDHFNDKLIEKMENNLSELSITMDEKASKTRGVLARIANEISLAGINIEEIVICPPEFLIYVKQEDIVKTYESVLKLRARE